MLDGCGFISSHKNERKMGLGVPLSYLMVDFWMGEGLW